MKFIIFLFALLLILKVASWATAGVDCSDIARIVDCDSTRCAVQLINGRYADAETDAQVGQSVCRK